MASLTSYSGCLWLPPDTSRAKGCAESNRCEPLLERIAADQSLPALARELFAMYGAAYRDLLAETKAVEEKLTVLHRSNEYSRRLAEILGVWPAGVSLLMMKTPDLRLFEILPPG